MRRRAPRVHDVLGFSAIRQRRPQIQTCLGLVAILTYSGERNGTATHIKQSNGCRESHLNREDPLQIEARFIELRS
jgi:hypothetical protein